MFIWLLLIRILFIGIYPVPSSGIPPGLKFRVQPPSLLASMLFQSPCIRFCPKSALDMISKCPCQGSHVFWLAYKSFKWKHQGNCPRQTNIMVICMVCHAFELEITAADNLAATDGLPCRHLGTVPALAPDWRTRHSIKSVGFLVDTTSKLHCTQVFINIHSCSPFLACQIESGTVKLVPLSSG